MFINERFFVLEMPEFVFIEHKVRVVKSFQGVVIKTVVWSGRRARNVGHHGSGPALIRLDASHPTGSCHMAIREANVALVGAHQGAQVHAYTPFQIQLRAPPFGDEEVDLLTKLC